jgi:hypothetical protein
VTGLSDNPELPAREACHTGLACQNSRETRSPPGTAVAILTGETGAAVGVWAIPLKEETALMSPGTEWPDRYSRLATREGWDIFDVDGAGYFEIQKDDCLEKFWSDDEAIDFVRAKAAAGSAVHRTALTIHEWYEARGGRPVPDR